MLPWTILRTHHPHWPGAFRRVLILVGASLRFELGSQVREHISLTTLPILPLGYVPM